MLAFTYLFKVKRVPVSFLHLFKNSSSFAGSSFKKLSIRIKQPEQHYNLDYRVHLFLALAISVMLYIMLAKNTHLKKTLRSIIYVMGRGQLVPKSSGTVLWHLALSEPRAQNYSKNVLSIETVDIWQKTEQKLYTRWAKYSVMRKDNW